MKDGKGRNIDMKKYVEKYTYSAWKDGSGWQIQGGYMGIDDNEYPEGGRAYNAISEDITNGFEYDLMSELLDPNSILYALEGLSAEEIETYANDDMGIDTQYTYTLYLVDDDNEEEEIYSISIWLSEVCKKYVGEE